MGKVDNFNKKRDLITRIYTFDNGMIITGLLNLYKLTEDPNLLITGENMAKALIDRFFDGSRLIAVLDKSNKPVIDTEDGGSVKWSTISGAYHSKLSLCLLDLSRLTNNPSIVKFQILSATMQKHYKSPMVDS